MGGSEFQYDAFLSYSSADEPKIRALAERLRGDGVDVWFDEWMIEPGDNIVLKMESGLESSRGLVLCMSEKAFGSDWVGMERASALFRDPGNKHRNFIPVLLEDCKIPSMIRMLRRIDWRREDPEEYGKLLKAIRKQPDGVPSRKEPTQLQNDTTNTPISGRKAMILHTRRIADSPSYVKVAVFPEPGPAERLLLTDGLLTITNWGSQSVQFVDPASLTLMRSVQMDAYEDRRTASPEGGPSVRRYPPESIAAAKGKLFVSQVFSEFVCAIDIRSGAIVKRIPVGGEGALATSTDGQYVYFANNRDNQLYIIDANSYQHRSVPFPQNGRGCLCCLALRSGLLYIGIQRGGSYAGGSFLAVFDTRRQIYLDIIPVGDATAKSDASTPIALLPAPDQRFLYVGMFQSCKGIQIIDVERHAIVDNISFEPNANNKHFQWVDPIALAWYRQYLLSVNRNNYELVFVEPATHATKARVALGGIGNGPRDIAIFGDRALISHKEMDGLLVVNLNEAITAATQ